MSDAPDPSDDFEEEDAPWDDAWWDEVDDLVDEEDALDRAYEECGYSPELGACTLGGTEHCDFECPFRDHPEIWFGEEE